MQISWVCKCSYIRYVFKIGWWNVWTSLLQWFQPKYQVSDFSQMIQPMAKAQKEFGVNFSHGMSSQCQFSAQEVKAQGMGLTCRTDRPHNMSALDQHSFTSNSSYGTAVVHLSPRSSVCSSVCLSVCDTGGSVKNGASYDHYIFTIGCLEDSSFRNRKAFP